MIKQVHLRWLITLAVACGAIVVFFPFFWMAITSLKTAPEIQRVPLQVAPDHWLNFSNYVEVFRREPFFRYLLNSAIVASVAAVIGSEVSYEVLSSVAKLPDDELGRHLAELVTARVLVPPRGSCSRN